MQVFYDRHSQSWDVDVTIYTIKAVRNRMGFDLLDAKTLIERIQDPIFLCDLLYCICKDQAEERGLSDEDFGKSLSGASIKEGRDAFLEAYANFIPDPKGQDAFREMIGRLKSAGDRILDVLEKRMEPILKKIDADLNRFVSEFETKLDTDSGISSSSGQA